jgi:hypothetical protein
MKNGERKNGVLLVAMIVGIFFMIVITVLFSISSANIGKWVTDGTLENDGGQIKWNTMANIIILAISLVAVALNFVAWIKNMRKIILLAAIIYIISFIGIPSAILCFIWFAKNKNHV